MGEAGVERNSANFLSASWQAGESPPNDPGLFPEPRVPTDITNHRCGTVAKLRALGPAETDVLGVPFGEGCVLM